jgi:secretion/DNA translocation related TadE-like protein
VNGTEPPADLDRQRGSGTVLVLALAAVAALLAAAVGLLGAAVLARHRVEAAADLGALAAAGAPGGADCGRAGAVVAAGGGTLVACTALTDGTVLVRVTRSGPVGLTAVAVARAGQPADGESGRAPPARG